MDCTHCNDLNPSHSLGEESYQWLLWIRAPTFYFILNDVSFFHTTGAAYLECKEAAIIFGLGHGRLNLTEMFSWKVQGNLLVYFHKAKVSHLKSLLFRWLSPRLGLPKWLTIMFLPLLVQNTQHLYNMFFTVHLACSTFLFCILSSSMFRLQAKSPNSPLT